MDVTELLNYFPEKAYGLFIFLSAFIENVFPPYPGDTVMVFGGYLHGTDRISLPVLILAIYFGNILSATFMYFMGEKVLLFFQKYIKIKSIRELLAPENLEHTHEWFEKYGFVAVIFSRFSAGIRFFVAIVAGMVKMNYILFLLAFSVATTIWNTLLVSGGYFLGENWEQVTEYLRVYNIIVGIIIAAVIVIAYIVIKRRKN